MLKCCPASHIFNSGIIPIVGEVRVEADCVECVMVDRKIVSPRTTRLHFAIPVFIYGSKDSGAPFTEITQTLAVNASGCLVELATPVVKEQPLLLTNMKTNEEMACSVVTLGSVVNGKAQVGLRFAQPSPRFWGLAFPPEDWDPATRKLPTAGKR